MAEEAADKTGETPAPAPAEPTDAILAAAIELLNGKDASDGAGAGDLVNEFSVGQLVSLGLAQLEADLPDQLPDAHAALAAYLAPQEFQRSFA